MLKRSTDVRVSNKKNKNDSDILKSNRLGSQEAVGWNMDGWPARKGSGWMATLHFVRHGWESPQNLKRSNNNNNKN